MAYLNILNKYLPEVKPYAGNDKRLKNLDFLKFICFFDVLFFHGVSYFCWEHGYWGVNIYYYFWNYIFPIAMPLLFTASGYMLLGRENATYHYSLKKILGVFKICFGAEAISEIIRVFLLKEHFTIGGFINDYFIGIFWGTGLFMVTWFLGALIVLYLLYPTLNRLYRSRPKIFLGIVIGCLVVQTVFFLRTLGLTSEVIPFETSIPQTWRLWNWVFYFCLGGLIKRFSFFWRLGNVWIAVGISLLNTCLFQMYLVRHYGLVWFEVTYASPICIVNVIAVFCFVLSKKIEGKWLNQLPLIFFPGFIIGDTMLEIGMILIVQHFNNHFGLFAYIAFVWVSTVIVTLAVTKIPIIKNLLKA